jgi:hypothetical protein
MSVPVEPEFWSTVTHRSPRPAKTTAEAKVAMPFSLFGDDANQGGPSSPKSEDEDSYAELEKYVQGLDGVDTRNLDVDSGDDDEHILQQLKQQLDNVEVPEDSPKTAEKKDGDQGAALESAEELDDDVRAILAQIED